MSIFRIIIVILAPTFLLLLNTHLIGQDVDNDTITFESSIVVLNAVVTAPDGRFVSKLTANDFQLRENGALQTIDFVESERTPYAAVILIDVSGSMTERISLARSAAIRFLDGIRPNDNVAIYSFDAKVKLVQEFSNSRDLRSAVFDLKAGGYTSLNDAVRKASEVLEPRKEKRRAIIVLSDGEDTRSRTSASNALLAAQKANATVYTVDMSGLGGRGLARRQNQAVLKRFARKTGGIFVSTPGGAEMRTAFENIVKELGVLYTIGYRSSDETTDGKWRAISLTSSKDVEIRTREGYYANKRN